MLTSTTSWCRGRHGIDHKVVDKHAPKTPAIARLERFAFYERARQAFAVVMAGDTRKYANIILKKGVTPL